MSSSSKGQPRFVTGPDGKILTFDDLPKADERHWTARKKAEVVLAVRGELIPLEDACKRYTLSVDEYILWGRRYDRDGLSGLKIKEIQRLRSEDWTPDKD